MTATLTADTDTLSTLASTLRTAAEQLSACSPPLPASPLAGILGPLPCPVPGALELCTALSDARASHHALLTRAHTLLADASTATADLRHQLCASEASAAHRFAGVC